MDDNKINDIIKQGFKAIDDEVKRDEQIREYSKYIALDLMSCFGKHVVNEYIIDENGHEVPIMFVLLDDVAKNGTPLLRLEVSDMEKVIAVAQYNNSTECVSPKVYTPATYTAPNDGTYSKEEIVQTLVTAAVAKLKGVIKIEELESEDEEAVTINVIKNNKQ